MNADTVFGMSLGTYTFVHVLISLVGIASGFVILFGLIAGKSASERARPGAEHRGRALPRFGHRRRPSPHQHLGYRTPCAT